MRYAKVKSFTRTQGYCPMLKNGLRVALAAIMFVSISGCSHKDDASPAQSADQQATAAIQTLSRMPASQRQAYVSEHPEITKSLQASTNPDVKTQFSRVMQP